MNAPLTPLETVTLSPSSSVSAVRTTPSPSDRVRSPLVVTLPPRLASPVTARAPLVTLIAELDVRSPPTVASPLSTVSVPPATLRFPPMLIESTVAAVSVVRLVVVTAPWTSTLEAPSSVRVNAPLTPLETVTLSPSSSVSAVRTTPSLSDRVMSPVSYTHLRAHET